MKQKNNNKSKIILGIILLIIVIACAIYVEILNKNADNIYSQINIDNSKLNIFFFNVGQADSTLITYEDKAILIDAGNTSDGKEILKFLNAKGISKIDYLIGTHIHEDHIGGFIDIINNIQLETIYMPNNKSTTTEYYENIIKNMENHNLKVTTVNQKDVVKLGNNISFEILFVDNTEPLNPNNASIVVQLEYEKQKYLFMGDAEKEVERRLLKEGILEDVDVLKVGHHGSDTSTTENFIKQVLPEIYVISVQYGRFNNMPSQEVTDRLNQNNNQVYRTDINGTIWLTSDGTTNRITILKELNLDGAYKSGMRVYFKYALFSYKTCPSLSTTL